MTITRRRPTAGDLARLRPTVRGETLLAPVAGLLTAYLALNAGGFFPDEVGFAAAALCLALLLRITLTRDPFGGWSATAAVGAGAAVLLAIWVLLSSLWSHAAARAVIEFDRVLLYGAAFALMACAPRRPGALPVLLRWVLLAIVAGAVVGLATRLYPDVFDAVAGRQPARLGYPLTYWNAMAVFCALGVVLAVHVASGAREPWWARAAACGALPILAVAGYFTFSRGGPAVAAVGLVLYVALAHGRRLAFTAVAGVAPAVVATVVAYGTDALATDTYMQGAGPGEGHRLAVVVVAAAVGAVLLRLVLLPLERRADAIALPPRTRRRILAGAGLAVVLAGAAVAVAVNAPERLSDQYQAFVRGNVVVEGTDIRSRFTAAGNNGRLDLWRVDRDAFESAPLHGTGAGTYQLEWERRRPAANQAVDGHSLYLETLADLGIVGLVLVTVLLAAVLAGPLRGLRGPERHAAAAVVAGGAGLLLHAGIDWDWEMPALFAWLFCAGGLAAAVPAGRAEGPGPARLTRVVAGLGCLVVMVTPLLVALSERSLHRARSAFVQGNCPAAVSASLHSIDALAVRPEPYEILGYCDLRARSMRLGVRAMEAAHRRDPRSWRYAYGLAVARALAGEDPRPALALARRLNPRAPEPREFEANLGRTPRSWFRAAARAHLPS